MNSRVRTISPRSRTSGSASASLAGVCCRGACSVNVSVVSRGLEPLLLFVPLLGCFQLGLLSVEPRFERGDGGALLLRLRAVVTIVRSSVWWLQSCREVL